LLSADPFLVEPFLGDQELQDAFFIHGLPLQLKHIAFTRHTTQQNKTNNRLTQQTAQQTTNKPANNQHKLRHVFYLDIIGSQTLGGSEQLRGLLELEVGGHSEREEIGVIDVLCMWCYVCSGNERGRRRGKGKQTYVCLVGSRNLTACSIDLQIECSEREDTT